MRKFLLLCGLVLVALSGCAAPASPATPRSLPTVPATSTPTETPAPTATATQLSATSTPPLTATPAVGEMRCLAAESTCTVPGHFIFQRPLAAPGNNNIDQTYRYATTQDETRDVHHGIDLPNKRGSPVLAVGDGLVIVAGDDKLEKYGWVRNFYGNLVVIEHAAPGYSQPVYTLYGHLSKVLATVGQRVKAGDAIGLVGSTGIAIGSHLHLEVRVGKNDYQSTRNPELWVLPPPGMGVLAGRVLDAQGRLVKCELTIERLEDGKHVYPAVTYARGPLNADDVLAENFAVGELVAGDYRVSLIYNGRLHDKRVTITASMLTVVEFRE